MSAKSTRQVQRLAWLRERRIHKPLVSRDEERVRFCQRWQALLVLAIPTGSLIFAAIFNAHADPFLTVERRASPPGWTGEGARPSIESLVAYGRRTRQAASLLQFRVFSLGLVEEWEVGVGIFPGGKKVLVGDAGFGNVALLLKQAAQLQLTGNEDYVGAVSGFHVQDLLKILLGLGVTTRPLVGHASNIKHSGIGASIHRSSVEEVDGLGRVGLGGIRGM